MAVLSYLVPTTPAQFAVAAVVIILSPLWYYLVLYLVDPLSLRRFKGPALAEVTPYWLFWQARHVRRFVKVDEAHKVLFRYRRNPAKYRNMESLFVLLPIILVLTIPRLFRYNRYTRP
jgi:hypothetical protein